MARPASPYLSLNGPVGAVPCTRRTHVLDTTLNDGAKRTLFRTLTDTQHADS